MPSSTFEHLSEKKKNTIILALLHEFSKVSLSKAQVAPIVKEAEIARGAFYILYNEHHIPSKPMSPDVSPLVWAVAELCHATIRESMSSPDKQDKYLEQLYIVLTKLLEN